jgi:hypothetical protein
MAKDRPDLMALVRRFGGHSCGCLQNECPPCDNVGKCARAALLVTAQRQIEQMRQFRLLQKEIADYANTDKGNICRLEGGRDEPRLGLTGLVTVIGLLSKALDETRIRFLTMSLPEAAIPVMTIDFCADIGDTDSMKQPVNDVLPARRIVKVIPRVGRAPVCEHADQRAAVEVLLHLTGRTGTVSRQPDSPEYRLSRGAMCTSWGGICSAVRVSQSIRIPSSRASLSD